ncbi:MAG: globin [Planctomycetota bacterium]|nr:globin [Planctomycetota bacterium]
MKDNSAVSAKTFEGVWVSYGRCCLSDGFLDSFYEIFLDSSPEVRAKFAQTDFVQQKRALLKSLVFVIMFWKGQEFAKRAMEHLAATHGSKGPHKIAPYFYGLWLDSLIKAIRIHDDQFTDDLEASWRQVMQVGIEFMISRY